MKKLILAVALSALAAALTACADNSNGEMSHQGAEEFSNSNGSGNTASDSSADDGEDSAGSDESTRSSGAAGTAQSNASDGSGQMD